MVHARIFRLTAAAALAVGLAALAMVPARAQERFRIKAGILPIVDLLQLFVGDSNGYFSQEGVKVETVTMAGGAQIAPAVEAGSLDLGWSNTVSIFLAHERGFDFVFFAPGAFEVDPNNRPHKLLIPADSPVTGAQDLVGKTIGVNTLANIPHVAVLAWLGSRGVDPSLVRFVEIPFPDMPAALRARRVDAALAIEPFVTVALSQGVARVLDPKPFAVFGKRVLVASWFAKRSWLERNRDAAAAFNRAIRKANDYIIRNPNEVRALIPRYTRVPPDLAGQIALPGFFPVVFESDIQPVIEVSVKNGLLKKSFPAREILIQIRH